jgi:hypothetical protein
MRKMGLRSVAHPDKAHALVELLADDERLGSISLDVAALEKLIRKLAKIRGSLSHRVPPRLSPDAQLEVTHLAPLFMRKQRWKESRVLCFRHPGYGWLAFTISDDHARNIANWLTSDAGMMNDVALMPSKARH